MTNQIVVGYDSSPSSGEAVDWAAAEAAVRDIALRIVACYEIPISAVVGAGWLTRDVLNSIKDGTAASAEAIKTSVALRHPGLQIDVEVSAGPARESLIQNLSPHDILVVGTSRHVGASRFWLGSMARWAGRHSPCPVVVVRGAASRGRPDRIVVGVDGSDSSDTALLWAADEADLHGVDLVIVHAWDYPYPGVDTRGEQMRDLIRIDAATVLDRSVERARERCGATVKDELIEGRGATALLDSTRDGDLLVIGAEGRGAIAAGFLGSTVNAVVEQAAAPVVIVR